jgi:hypothetical protein
MASPLSQDARLLGRLHLLGLAFGAGQHLIFVGLAPFSGRARVFRRARLGAPRLVGPLLVGFQRFRGAARGRFLPGLVGLQLGLALTRILCLARCLALVGFRLLGLFGELFGNRMRVIGLRVSSLRAGHGAH